MQNNKYKQEEMTQEESTTAFTNYFGASSFKEDSLEEALTDFFQNS